MSGPVFRYHVLEGEKVHEVLVEEVGENLRLTFQGITRNLEMTFLAPTRYHVRIDGRSFEASVRQEGPTLIVDIGPERYEFQVRPLAPMVGKAQGAKASPLRASIRRVGTGAATVAAPMPGLLVSVEVREGDRVTRGQAVAIMEAMKMQMEVRASVSGVVRAIHARPGQEVKGGQVLITLG